MNTRLLLTAVTTTAACLTGCAIAPSHPALSLAALPELIPVREFVADRQASGGHQVSPDGKRLAWFGASGVRSAVWVKTLGQADARALPLQARYFRWSADSQHLLLVADPSGDENTHVFAAPVTSAGSALVDLTPYDKTVSYIEKVVEGGSRVIIASNQRNKKVFDLVTLDLATGAQAPLATNPGQVGWWGVDRQGRLRARVLLEGERSLLQRPDASAGAEGWATTASWSRFDTVHSLVVADDGQSAWALSNRGRDTVALVRLDLASGAETVVYAVPGVDVDSMRLSRKTQTPLIASAMPGYPLQQVFDAGLRERLTRLANGQPMEAQITSMDDAEQTLTVAAVTDRGAKTYVYTAASAEPELLGENALSRVAGGLSATRPIAYTTRDGFTVYGYLTLPAGVAAQGLPMVLLVHGGPWARDRWSGGNANRALQQFLANRGYAVLQVNYRGSSGYGRAFMEAGIGESAGKMHDDLIDGVRWAVATGVADPAKVAIYGASYGGYAALVGATFTPEVFACAVDVVGVADWASTLKTAPAYWELGKPWWTRYVGDPDDPEQRKAMDARSPLYKADQARNPILVMHGVNDPRVRLEQSEMMVAALRKAGKPVEFVTFKGDGHGNQKWTNNLTMYRKAEDFLARCLGGRSSGFDYYELGAWAF